MTKTEEKLDKIIKLLEEIKANQPMVYYPAIVYPPQPQPYIRPPDPWHDGTHWTSGETLTIAYDGGGNLYQ